MAKNGLPNSLEALLLMSDSDFTPSTVDTVIARLKRATTDFEKNKVLDRMVELLENGISEADFLKELEK